MLRKKMAALLAVLITAITLINANHIYAAEVTNLVLGNTQMQSLMLPAGGKIHMALDFS